MAKKCKSLDIAVLLIYTILATLCNNIGGGSYGKWFKS